MGIYINRGNSSFTSARRSEYVDKSELVSFINGTINTGCRLTCVSRARRFGNLLLVGISYDRETKKHSCKMELFKG